MKWTTRYDPECLGILPAIIHPNSNQSAKEQIEVEYSHGGGYLPFGDGKFTLENWPEIGRARLRYPGDPAFGEIARCVINATKETCILFDSELVAVVQYNGDFEIIRMD